MAVTQIKEIARSRDGEYRSDGSKRHRRVLRVWCSDPADNDATVLAAVKVTAGYRPVDAFPGDGTSFPRAYRPTQEHEMLIWLCDIDYSNEEDDPLNDAVVLKVSGQLFSEPMIVDAYGHAVCNSAGFPIVDPPIERDRSRGLITFSKNLATPPAWVFTYQNTLNQAGFAIWGGAITAAASTAKFREPDVSGPHERNGHTYYTVSGTIEVDTDGWKVKAVDQGWHEKDPSDSSKRIAITMDDGTEIQQPAFLNGAGRRLTNPTPSTAVVLEFTRHLPVDWSALVALLS